MGSEGDKFVRLTIRTENWKFSDLQPIVFMCGDALMFGDLNVSDYVTLTFLFMKNRLLKQWPENINKCQHCRKKEV